MSDETGGGLGGRTAAARRKAEDKAVAAIEAVIEVMEAKDPPRGAQSRVMAAKLVLDVAGVTNAMTAERALEALLGAMRRHCSQEAYGELIRAFAAVRGVVAGGARDATGGKPH
jgi:hypothetical protein